jgi:hypothetical protein
MNCCAVTQFQLTITNHEAVSDLLTTLYLIYCMFFSNLLDIDGLGGESQLHKCVVIKGVLIG